MPRVFTSVAAKDYPAEGITKGSTYWHWTPYRSRKRRSATMPRPSQYESNETKAAVYGAIEDLADFLNAANDETTAQEVEDLIESCKDTADGTRDEMQEKADNIEDGFGHETEQSQQLRDWGEQIEQWGDDLDGLTPVENVQETLEELSGLLSGPEF